MYNPLGYSFTEKLNHVILALIVITGLAVSAYNIISNFGTCGC